MSRPEGTICHLIPRVVLVVQSQTTVTVTQFFLFSIQLVNWQTLLLTIRGTVALVQPTFQAFLGM